VGGNGTLARNASWPGVTLPQARSAIAETILRHRYNRQSIHEIRKSFKEATESRLRKRLATRDELGYRGAGEILLPSQEPVDDGASPSGHSHRRPSDEVPDSLVPGDPGSARSEPRHCWPWRSARPRCTDKVARASRAARRSAGRYATTSTR
jgi:hypothetical protein